MTSISERSSTTSEVLEAAVRAQLDRIVAHPSFAQAPQLSRFLWHVVQHTLADERRELKEYSLGIAVFNRGNSFDPRNDNVVRSNARRLRQRLEAYYQSDGVNDPIVIELPKGHYVASWHPNRTVALAPATCPDSGMSAPRVCVRMPDSANSSLDGFADAVIEELLIHLTKMKSLDASLTDELADYELGCSVVTVDDSLRISARLVFLKDAAVLWAQSFEPISLERGLHCAVLIAHMVDSVIDAHLNYQAMTGFDPTARRELAKGQIEWRSWALGAGGSARVAAEHWRAALRREPRLWWAQLQIVGYLANRIDHPPIDQCIAQAHRAARELLALRSNEPLYPGPIQWALVIGMVSYRLDLDYQLAEECLNLAKIQGWDPGQVDSELGNLYAAAGRLEQAVHWYEDALARDAQLNQTSTLCLLGRTQIALRQYRAAAANLETAFHTSQPGTPTHLFAQLELIEAHWGMGSTADAEQALQHAWAQYGERRRRWFAPAFALLQHGELARTLIDELIGQVERGRKDDLYPIFAAYALLGDFDNAFQWLNLVIDNREVFRFVTIRNAPYLEPLRRDPRFPRAMRRLRALESRGSPLRPLVEEALHSF